MADENENIEAGKEKKEKKKNPVVKFLIIVAVILAVDLIGGVFIGAKVIIPMLYGTTEVADDPMAGNSADAESGKPAAPGVKIPLEPINLNPSGSNGEILSCNIVLEADSQDVVNELSLRNYEIMDKLSTYLAFKTVDDLNDQENWEQYKQDMFDIINDSLANGNITALYVPSRIIQFN